jgi:hypothetical protein
MSERKAGHRRRRREPGEDRTPKLPARRCKATTKAGEPCRSPSALSNGFCVSHQRLAEEPIPDKNGELFGSPEQVKRAQRDRGSLKFPRLQEVVERELEAKCEEIVKAHLEGLIATRTHVDAKGGEHTSPDHDTRWRAAASLLDRALGKPSPSADETANMTNVVNIELIENPEMRLRAEQLRHAIAATRIGPSKFGPGE